MGGNLTADESYDLFKFTVELADRTSVRRSAANTFFVSLHSIVAGFVGYLAAVRTTAATDRFSLTVLAVVGVVLSLTWWSILRYFRRLSKAKWEVINEMETALGINPFKSEWDRLHPGGQAAGWWKRQSHREATLVEQIVPLTFAAVYVALAIRIMLS